MEMCFVNYLLLSCWLCAISVRTQSTSSVSSEDRTSSTGASELSDPTGPYMSYASTVTASSSAIATLPIVSTLTSPSTQTTTIGETTIFGIDSEVVSKTSSLSSAQSLSQTYLRGSGRGTSSNSTNETSNSTSTTVVSSTRPTNTQPCNNYVPFCSRKYSNITEVSAHNSPFVRSGNVAANQNLPVITQLNDGIRLLQGQMHFVGTVPHFCHTSCDVLDAGPITEYLGSVHEWVSSHPYDVVTILLGNGDFRSVTDYVPFLEQTNLLQYAYVPPKIPMSLEDWPTLGSMILTGKRVVLFMDYSANQTLVPYLLDEFSQMWETPFSPTNRSFPCTLQRPPSLSSNDAKSRMYLLNHNLNYEITLLGNSLLVPNLPLLNVTNNVTGEGSLGVGTENCVADWNFPPRFLNVDFYESGGTATEGTVFEVAARWNGVKYQGTCCGGIRGAAGRLLDSRGWRTIWALAAMAAFAMMF